MLETILNASIVLGSVHPWLALLLLIAVAALLALIAPALTEPGRRREQQEIREKVKRGDLPPHLWIP